jgi:hypothetical protein
MVAGVHEGDSVKRQKRRTVLYLHEEDYAYLETVADADGDTRGRSVTKLIRYLRAQNITSFEELRRKIAPVGATSLGSHVN